ncbi:hypothetical protein ART_4269 [Arthrobacter sp. PAMC 25486]|nr:hypothetical protein ART_4269 [Arthrobacter sp. PAMC 25486]
MWTRPAQFWFEPPGVAPARKVRREGWLTRFDICALSALN